MPADERQAAEPRKKKETGWLFTLKAPSYGPLMQYADNRALRKRMYVAYSTRASELSPNAVVDGQSRPEWDNAPLMQQIMKLRAEEAHLLGFVNFAELSLETKMASTPQQVNDFLRKLAQRARPFAERDLAELREFSHECLGITDLQPWDISYASEHLRQQRYAFSEQEVKQYFPEDKVLEGMFKLVESLFGLHVRSAPAPLWHMTVSFMKSWTVKAGWLDSSIWIYMRAATNGGAWMDDAITRRRTAVGIQTPVAYLNCTFAPPVGDRQAYFTHDEVITLFHEFGHGLHHMPTQVEDLGVSGINGVEWDAVELPVQLMENFCWEWEVLQI